MNMHDMLPKQSRNAHRCELAANNNDWALQAGGDLDLVVIARHFVSHGGTDIRRQRGGEFGEFEEGIVEFVVNLSAAVCSASTTPENTLLIRVRERLDNLQNL